MQMSYWVPTVILLFDKLKIRGRATQKFYEIAVVCDCPIKAGVGLVLGCNLTSL